MKRELKLATLLLCGLIVLGGLLYLLQGVAVPFLIALILAYFLNPAVHRLEGYGLSRTLAVTLAFVVLVAASLLLLSFLVPAIQRELSLLEDRLPAYAEGLYRLIPAPLLNYLNITGGGDFQSLLDRGLAALRNVSFEAIKQVLFFLSRAFSSTFALLVAVLGYFIIPVYLFYLLRDFELMKSSLKSCLPRRWHDQSMALAGEIDQVLSGFLRGQLSVCLVLAVCYSVGLILIGIDLGLVIGLISGAAFIIPYLGTIFGIVVAGTMAAVQYQDLLHPALVVGLFAAVQGVEGTVITPRLVGGRVGLHPLETILAVLSGGELFGFLGLLLAVPAAAAFKVLLRRGLVYYRQSGFYLDRSVAGD